LTVTRCRDIWIPFEIFFDLLLERSSARASQPLNLEVAVVDDRLG
jgi:hypothetical protein